MAYKIYSLLDKTGIRYIGLTKHTIEHRFKQHLRDKTSTHRTKWIRKLLREGQEPYCLLLQDNIESLDAAAIAEISWISFCKKAGFDLVNGTNGGDTGATDAVREKISAAKKGSRNPMFGKKHSAQTKLKMRDSHLGEKNIWYKKSFSDEHRQKLSESHRGQSRGPLSEETKQKIREARLRDRIVPPSRKGAKRARQTVEAC